MIKNQNKNRNLRLRIGKLMFMTGIALMLSVSSFATDPGGSNDPGGNNGLDVGGTDPDNAPFDGGISLLVAAGVAYGAKQWQNARKKTNGEEGNKEAEV